MENHFPFHLALNHLGNFKVLRRNSWPPDTFIYRQVPRYLDIDIVPSLVSMPQHAKDLVQKLSCQLKDGILTFSNQIMLLDFNKGTINQWSATAEDLFAEDWIVYPEPAAI